MRLSANRKAEDVDVRSDEIARKARGGPCINRRVGKNRKDKNAVSQLRKRFSARSMLNVILFGRSTLPDWPACRCTFAPTLIRATGYDCLISVAGNHESISHTGLFGAHQYQLQIRFTVMFKSMVMIVSTAFSLNTRGFIKAIKSIFDITLLDSRGSIL